MKAKLLECKGKYVRFEITLHKKKRLVRGNGVFIHTTPPLHKAYKAFCQRKHYINTTYAIWYVCDVCPCQRNSKINCKANQIDTSQVRRIKDYSCFAHSLHN